MSLYTRAELRQGAQRLTASLRKSAATVLHEGVMEFSTSGIYDIFLSHSVLNADEIVALKYDIEGMGFSVYVDWIEDPQLDRSRVTKDNASIIRARMDRCKSLFFATSDVSPNSKWMPWELGYFDGKKEKAAILPISDSTTNHYSGQEYLGLYPYVTKDPMQGSGNETLWIHESALTYITFEAWLAGSKPTKRS